ncbi:MAG: hypothetical protein J4400_03635 [Candidatus Aenigmarchaeota archaeon]|nr:hypothetical protein [Candidatus Aenigmarchaeota archaeon]
MDEKFQYRRLPAVPKSIIDINPEKDVRIRILGRMRIRILGRIIDKQDGTIVIDDGTSTAQIITDAGLIDAGQTDAKGVIRSGAVRSCETNDFVCVFARVLPLEDGYELRGEIVQNRNNMDMDLHRKIYG